MSEEQAFQVKSNDNIIEQIVYRYLPYWPILLISCLISLSIATLYLRSQTRIYVASAKALLKDPQKSGGDTKVLDAMNIFTEKKTVENEIIVLKSTSLINEVVKSLDLYASVYNEGKFQTEELYASNSPLKFIALNKDSINYGGRHEFTIDWDKKNIEITGKTIPFNGTVKFENTEYKVSPNNNYNKLVKGKNYFVVFNSILSTSGSIIGSIKAAPLSFASTVIDIKIETPTPEKGIDILSKLFKVYNSASIEDKNQMAVKTLAFIEERLGNLTGQLDSVEKNIEQYKSRNELIDLSNQGAEYFNNVRELDKKESVLSLQLEILNDVEKYVNLKGRNKGTVPSLILLDDPTLQKLIENLYDAEFELDKIQSVSGIKNEVVLVQQDKIDRIKSDIKESIRNIRSNYSTQRRILDIEIKSNKNLYASIPQKERELLEISRQRAIKNDIYNFLLQKREETALSSVATSADLRVLENPNSYGPISPIAKNFYWAGFLIGLIIFILYIQLYEQLNNKIMFRSEVEKQTSVPIVAEVVQAKTDETIAIRDGKRTVIAEQFRTLRTNLSFMGFNEKEKVLLVTSSISGEGKAL